MWSRGELYPGVGYVVGLSCISVLRVGLWAGATGSRLPWLHGLLFFWERSSLDKVHFPPRSLFLRDTVTVLVLSITFLLVLLFFSICGNAKLSFLAAARIVFTPHYILKTLNLPV